MKEILAIRLDNLGDVVMTGPALRALRQAYPDARITLLASPAGSQAAPLLPWIDSVITWRAIWQDIAKNVPVEPEKEYQRIELLKAGNFDAAFIFTSFSQSPHPPAYACYLAGIPIRVGQSKEFGGGLLNPWIPSLPDERYQVDRNLHLLESIGLPIRERAMQLQVPIPSQRSAETLLAQHGISDHQDYIVLAPGASAAARRYPEARFAEAIQNVIAETGFPVILIGSRREVSQYPTLEDRSARNKKIISLIGKTTVAELAAILSRSTLVICNNSAAMHIAAAFHRPMVVLYSGTELREQWAPTTKAIQILNRATPCSPCHGFQCPYHLECLDIPPDEIVAAARNLLGVDLSRRPAPANSIKTLTWR